MILYHFQTFTSPNLKHRQLSFCVHNTISIRELRDIRKGTSPNIEFQQPPSFKPSALELEMFSAGFPGVREGKYLVTPATKLPRLCQTFQITAQACYQSVHT